MADSQKPYDCSFYNQNTAYVAQNLLGSYLHHQTAEGDVVGKIVETEAYLSKNDTASHSHNGPTKRNQAMFGPPGHSYVYRIYGLHLCFNVVTAPITIGEAVLIRALEPIQGIELMQKRRSITDLYKLCNGPANLVVSLGISMEDNNICVTQPPLWIMAPEEEIPPEAIISGPRIGIGSAHHLPLRFYIQGSPFVSKITSLNRS